MNVSCSCIEIKALADSLQAKAGGGGGYLWEGELYPQGTMAPRNEARNNV